MLNKNRIEEIIGLSTKSERKLSFPEIFKELKLAGVEYYDVVLKDDEVTYHGKDNDTLVKKLNQELPTYKENQIFDGKKVKEAIVHHTTHETNYSSFMMDILNAGVVKYQVCMIENTCTYFGKEEAQKHVENVPQI